MTNSRAREMNTYAHPKACTNTFCDFIHSHQYIETIQISLTYRMTQETGASKPRDSIQQ